MKIELTPEQQKIAVELLTEAREACAASFRVIAASNDPTITDRLDTELKMAGVKEGFGARIQNFIAANAKLSGLRVNNSGAQK